MDLRTAFSLLLCSLLFTGCDLWHQSDDDDEQPTESVLLPLDLGNQWVMAFTRFDAEGTLTESYTDTLRVVSDTTVAGERWAEIRCTQTPRACVPGGYYTNRDDGVWRWRDPSSDGAPYLLYKYPAEVGDTYAQPSSFADLSMTVLDTEASVETPAGSLSAYHYVLDANEVNGSPVPDEVGQLDRFLIPEQGFAVIDCSFLTRVTGEWDTFAEFSWELIAFEGN